MKNQWKKRNFRFRIIIIIIIIIIGVCMCCQGVDLGIGKDFICKYIIIIINNEKKHETYCFILRTLCV